MKLSLIVPTYGRPEQISRAIHVLVGQVRRDELTEHVEIIVVDDGNEPPIASRVRDAIASQNESFLHYLRLSSNSGVGAARNAGVAASRGDIIAFLDDDIVPGEDYLRAILRTHAEQPQALIINGTLRPLRNDVYSRFWYYHYDAVFNRSDTHFYPVRMIGSGNVSLKRAALELEDPLFDVSLTACEDHDLFLRFEARSIPVFKDDRIVAFNECRKSMRAFLAQRRWYDRGNEQLAAKYGEAFLAARRRQLAPPNRSFLHLYMALRIARTASRLRRRIMPRLARTFGRRMA